MFEAGEELDYELEFVNDFNSGNTKVLSDFLSRWLRTEDATRVSKEAFKRRNEKDVTLTQLHELVATSMLAMSLSKGNFANIYPAIKESIVLEPTLIFDYMVLDNIVISSVNSGTVIELHFECDWDGEGGVQIAFFNNELKYVGNSG